MCVSLFYPSFAPQVKKREEKKRKAKDQLTIWIGECFVTSDCICLPRHSSTIQSHKLTPERFFVTLQLSPKHSHLLSCFGVAIVTSLQRMIFSLFASTNHLFFLPASVYLFKVHLLQIREKKVEKEECDQCKSQGVFSFTLHLLSLFVSSLGIAHFDSYFSDSPEYHVRGTISKH